MTALLVIGFDSPPEWGLVGFVVVALVAGFLWMVKAMRSDMAAQQAADREALHESQRQFIHHLTTTGERQTEARVASTVATQQLVVPRSMPMTRDMTGGR